MTAPRRSDEKAAASLLLTRVAQMHFVDRLTNLAIAERLGISRFRVARLIDQAVDSGTVTFQIATPAAVDPELSHRLRARWSLTEALVLQASTPSPGSTADADRVSGVSRLAVRFLADYLTDGASLGISWGTTIDGVAAELETMPNLPTCDVVQLEGHPSTLEHSTYAGDVLRRFASAFGGAVHALHAPLVVPTLDAALGIGRERSVARTLEQAREVDLAMVGIGSWTQRASHLMDTLPPDEAAAVWAKGPAADVCAQVLDAEGQLLDPDLAERTIAATLDDLRELRLTVGVASGMEKATAVRAALRSGVLDAVIVDSVIARACLQATAS